jgi:uncharacterized protein YuzE
MNTTYDTFADAVYITLKKGKVSRTLPLANRLMVDLDSKGNILGMEILDAKKQMGIKGTKNPEFTFSVPVVA